jgi:hypothetical protein
MSQSVRAQPDGGDLAQIGKSTALVESFERAHKLAIDQGHGVVTLEHLLFALTEDPEAAGVLASSDVSIDRLRTDLSGYLGRLADSLPPANGPSALPGKDLLRILQLAGTAARQSPRRLVDGAIVIAAVVGEANSPSAGMLKAHGLTFEAVIRALQRASLATQPASLPPPVSHAPQSAPPAPPVIAPPRMQTPGVTAATEDMLASVRARVKQAEPPPIGVRILPADRGPSQPSSTAASVAASPRALPEAAGDGGAPAPSAAQGVSPAVEPRRAAAGAAPAAMPGRSGPPPLPNNVQPTAPGHAPEPGTERAPPVNPPAPAPAAGAPPMAGLRVVAAGEGPARPPLPTQPAGPAAGAVLPPPLPTVAAPPPAAALPPKAVETVAPSPPGPPAPQAPQAPQVGGVAQPGLYAPPPPTIAPFDIIAAARGIIGAMPLGVPTAVEIRIPREQIDIVRAANWQPPRGAPPNAAGQMARPEVLLTRAVGVQLTSEPTDALLVTPLTPETVWFDRPILAPGEVCIWRFTVTPQQTGRHGLTLAVLGRTIGPAGIAIDPAAASETFEIIVRGGRRATAIRLGGYLVAFAAGAVTAMFAHGGLVALLGSGLKTILR